MHAFESLLACLSSRAATFGATSEGGQFVRFDNDLYFHPVRIPHYFFWPDVLQLRFYLFFNPDGSHATPPIGILGSLLTPHAGYDFSVPGGIGGDPAVRARRRELRSSLGWGRPMMTFWRVKDSRPLPPEAPRRWAEVGFQILPKYRKGPEGYDWTELGSQILASVETLLHLLERAGQAKQPRPVAPP